MCFSAEASFTASVILSAVGVASTREVSKPKQRLFAAIPLLFGLQQFAEGVVWVTLRSGGYDRFQNVATYIFLVAALVIWPVIVPLSMWLMEDVKKRKKILAWLTVAGGVLSVYYVYCLIYFNVTPRINGFHIQYLDAFPRRLVDIAWLLYIASTVAPLFVSSVRRMWVFGVLISISCLVTIIFFSHYLTSVWCFFAALISATIFWILSESRRRADELAPEYLYKD